MHALNQAEKALFELICPEAQGKLALVSTEFNGIETGCISWVAQDEDAYNIIPLAVLVNDKFFTLLKRP